MVEKALQIGLETYQDYAREYGEAALAEVPRDRLVSWNGQTYILPKRASGEPPEGGPLP